MQLTGRRSILAAAATVGAVTLAASATPVSAHTVALPDSMAATGDSIAQPSNVDDIYAGHDNPQFPWSTGTDPTITTASARAC